MPLVRKIEHGIWELRVSLDKRTARVIFTVIDDTAVLVHGFIKKSRKIPGSDLAPLRRRAGSLGR
jgi:phage-related protein